MLLEVESLLFTPESSRKQFYELYVKFIYVIYVKLIYAYPIRPGSGYNTCTGKYCKIYAQGAKKKKKKKKIDSCLKKNAHSS
jgi:hypothetical protein